MNRIVKCLKIGLACVLALPIVGVAQTATAADDGLVTIGKAVVLPSGITQPGIPNTPAGAGDQFIFRLTWGCTTNNPPAATCDNVVVTDVIPAELQVVGSYPANYTFTPALPNPSGPTTVSIALGNVNNGQNGTFDLTVNYRNDTSLATNDTVTVTNTATIAATVNGQPATNTSNTVSVTGVVRPIGGATAGKTLNPSTVGEFTQAPVAVNLTGGNTGTVAGSTFTLSDTTAQFFDAVDLTSVPTPAPLAGATGPTIVEVLNAGVWSTLSTPFTGPVHVDGIRVVYQGIASGETSSFPFSVQLRDAKFSTGEVVIGSSVALPNTVTSAITYPDTALNTGSSATAILTVNGVVLNPPVLQKTFSPSTLVVGSSMSTTINLTANNSGQGGLSSISIVDPSPAPGADNPFISTLDVTAVSVVWPTTDLDQQATLTTNCAAPVTISYPTTSFVLPGGCTPAAVTSVGVTFVRTAGVLPSNATPQVNIVASLQAGAPAGGSPNDARTTTTTALGGLVATGDATNVTLTVSAPTYSVITNKVFSRPSTFGRNNSVALRTTNGPNPGDAAVDQLVIQDSSVLPTPNGGVDFWDQYDITAIRRVDCPSNYSVLVQYYNGTSWVTMQQAGNSNGCQWTLPYGLTMAERAAAQSIRFTYTNNAGQIPAPQTFQPEFAIRFRDTNRDTGTAQPQPVQPAPAVESAGNCSRADIYLTASPVASDVLTGNECPTVSQEPLPTGDGFGVTKTLLGAGVDQAASGREGSGRLMDVSISASLSPGLNVDQLKIQDPIEPETAPTPFTFAYYSHVFAAVTDIVNVGPVTVPQFAQGVIEFYDGTTWTPRGGVQLGGQQLVAAGSASDTAWRIVITENPADPGIDIGQLETEGITLSVPVQYRLRDTFRSAIGPHAVGDLVLNNICYGHSNVPMDDSSGVPTGTCDLQIAPFTGASFNTPSSPTDAGWLHNNVQGTASLAGSVVDDSIDTLTNTESEFRILNGVLNGEVLKSFSPDDQVPLPATGVAPGATQERTMVLIGRNTNPVGVTGAGVIVDELALIDNDTDFWQNFEFVSATTALGGSSGVLFDVDFAPAGAGGSDVIGISQAALNALVNKTGIVGITARFANMPAYLGTVATEANASYVVRLRATSTNVNTYVNSASIRMTDITQTSPYLQNVDAPITVRNRRAGVVAGKTITLVGPNAIDLRPKLDVDMTATNSLELDLLQLTAEDDDQFTPANYASPSVPAVLPANTNDFWPNVDFVGVNSVTAPTGAENALVQYWDGSAWVAVGNFTVGLSFNAANVTAGLPADLTLIKGLRVVFSTTSGTEIQPLASGGINFRVAVKTTVTPDVALTNCSEAGLGMTSLSEYQNPACASFTPLLGTQRVDVAKTSTNTVVNAGTSERFTLTITNNGQQALGLRDTAPFTIVDVLPAQLVYNFAVANVVATFPTVGGTSNLTGTLPVVAVVGNELQWVFPAGQYLGSGETITIAITLEVAPAVAAGTPIVNAVGVPMPSGANCTSPDTYVAGRCTSTVSLSTISGGAIRAVKSIDGSGSNVLAAGGACPTATGFVGTPCVAVVAAGSTYTWRLTLQNSGNTNLSDVVLIDRLPAAGDTGAYAPFQRGTEWRGTPVPGVAPVVTTPGMTTPPLQYLPASAAASLAACTGELNTGVDCGLWLAVGAGSIPVGALAVRLAVPYGVGGNPTFLPGDSVTIQWDETAPITLAGTVPPTTDTSNPTGATQPDGRLIEWNSFGFRALGGTSVLRNESNKAGALFDSAVLSITKLVDENTVIDPLAFGSFTIQVSCTLPDDTLFSQTVVLTHNQTITIPGLPTDTECTLLEDNAPPDFQWVPDKDTVIPGAQITIAPATQFATVTAVITNIFGNGAALLVDKALRGDPGSDIDYGFTAACTFGVDGNGQPLPIVLNAGDAAFRWDADSGYFVIDNLPSGATCTVTETDNGSADYTDIESSVGGIVTSGTRGTGGAAITVAQIDAAKINIVTVTNTYLADFEVTKTVVEDTVAPASAFGPFEFEVTCTNLDESSETVNVTGIRDGDTFGWTGTLELLAGATCTITETETGGAQTVTINGDETDTIEIGPLAQGTEEVAVDNSFDAVAISVHKKVRGVIVPAPTFNFSVECTFNDVDITDSLAVSSFTLVNGGTQTINGLPVGTDCVVKETNNGGANYTDVSVGGGTSVRFQGSAEVTPAVTVKAIAGGETVLMVNTFLATISVSKVVVNQTVLAGPFGPFMVKVACALEDGSVETVVFSISNGETVKWTGTELLAGSTCTVTETNSGRATTIDIDGLRLSEGSAATVALVGQGNTTAKVTNTYLSGQLQVKKVVAGVSPVPTFAYQFALSCARNGAEFPLGADATFTLTGGATKTIVGLPLDADCSVIETNAGGAVTTRVAVNNTAAVVAKQAFVTTSTVPATVVFTNDFAAVSPPGSGGLPTTGSDVLTSVVIGLLMMLVGWFLVVINRRRRTA